MPRLVKTVTEMEGRFEEKWVLVEDDGIVPWAPEAELAVVGRPAPRQPVRSASRATPATRSTSRCPACSTPRCCARRWPAVA